MPSYLTFAEYKTGSRLRDSVITTCGQAKVEAFLAEWSGTIRDRLVKRYVVDFTSPGPVPDTIARWLRAFVDHDVQEFVGGIPEGREDDWIQKRFDLANEELKEAASSETGLFELPTKNTDALGSSAVNRGAPLGYSEASPYTWTDRQYDAVSQEVIS